MAQGRKKNSRRRGVKPSERAAAQAQRQNEKAERKDRIQHILVVAFAVIMALGMLIPSLAAIFGGNDQAQQITDSEGKVYEISSDGTITLISSPTVADLDAEFGPQIEELVSTLEKRGPHLQLRQEPQGTSDFRLRSQGPCRLGTGESGLVLG